MRVLRALAFSLLFLFAAQPLYCQFSDDFSVRASGTIYSLAVQADGGILAGGFFTSLVGGAGNGVGRATADGILDMGFNSAVDGGCAYSLAVQNDGKVLVGGVFTNLSGQPRSSIGRLNPDGSLDEGFNPGVAGGVYSIAVQADGKILVGGAFSALAGQSRKGLGRLNGDGTLDLTFNAQCDNSVQSLAVQSDGKIVVGGYFSKHIGRLNGDGTVDSGFEPPTLNWAVKCVAIQSDGKILIGGDFTMLDTKVYNHLARLNADGTVDAAFNPGVGVVCPFINSLAVQADGKIVVVGYFDSLAGQGCTNIGRLFNNGDLDTSFRPSVSGVSVYGLAMQGDGQILLPTTVYNFAEYHWETDLRRLTNSPAFQSVVFDGTNVTWLRDGSCPEVWRASFEVSTNGATWIELGSGNRFSGGWELKGISTPPNSTIRARGYVFGGYGNGSTWYVEDCTGPPLLVTQPLTQTNALGTRTILRVFAEGAPMTYQWRKNGVDLVDGVGNLGTQSPVLNLTNVFGADQAGYSVFIRNDFGCTTSVVANLTVLDPFITTQPVSQTAIAGQSVVFTVNGSGSAPATYEWLKNGVSLEKDNVFGKDTPTLTLSNVMHADVAGYSLSISNAYGRVTSQVATLEIREPAISIQPLDQMVFSGEIASFSVGAMGTPLLDYQWRKDGTNISGATAPRLTITSAQLEDRGNYVVVVTNLFGCVTSSVAMLTVDQAILDLSFPSAGVDSSIYAFAVQPDGRIVIGGSFTSVGGQYHTNLVRVNADGSVDARFNASTDYPVYGIALQEDGRIVVGGTFRTLSGQLRLYLRRLNADGSLDESFKAQPDGPGFFAYDVLTLTMQLDGKILVGGAFETLDGQDRKGIGRLNPNGTLDSTFNPAFEGVAKTLTVQPDGKILVGGRFNMLGGQPRSNLGRLSPDGTLDSNFLAQATCEPWLSCSVNCLAVQANGQILVGGDFSQLCGVTRYVLGRLNSDGTLDETFAPGGPAAVVGSSGLAVQADGKILTPFSSLAGQSWNHVGRLDADGGWDTSFDPIVVGDWPAAPFALQADGQLLVGGYSTIRSGRTDRFGRLKNTGPGIQYLVVDESNLSWVRNGTAPEIWCARFEASTNGSDWYPLGMGARRADGWHLEGLSVPPNATIRARGMVSGSGSIMESVLALNPTIQPRILLDSHIYEPSTGFGFDVEGPVGQAVVVQSSTNLVDWAAVATNTLVTGRWSFTDNQREAPSPRYYRLASYPASP